jgi:exodeoxyribonuclease-5
MDFDADQDRVLREARAWLSDDNGPQVKYLAGYAGTGKTTLAQYLADGFAAHFCAYTGKAALVLRQKGCSAASTIHSLIYKAQESRVCSVCARRIGNDYNTCYSRCKDSKALRTVQYKLRTREWGEWGEDSEDRIFELADCGGVVIVDECSMISDEVAKDLMSFGVKILVIGDPFQRPPVNGEGWFTRRKPDWMLTQIHRQAKESGVLRLATDIRENGFFDRTRGAYGSDVEILPQSKVDLNTLYEESNQLLVGRNVTRRYFNTAARELLGLRGPTEPALPTIGDKLVCLRNDRDTGLVNGGQFGVFMTYGERETLTLDIATFGDPDAELQRVTAHHHYFTSEEDSLKEHSWNYRKQKQEFDYGYAMTVHKAQGSAWEHVGIIDESGCFRESRLNWLYTALTRSSKKVTLIV